MIDGLIGGRLYGKAAKRTGPSGKSFVVARVRAAMGDGDSMMVSVIAFAEPVQDALLALQDGDSVCLSGALTPKVWRDKQGGVRPSLDLTAHAVLTAYHVGRKRKAAPPVEHATLSRDPMLAGLRNLADDLPWKEGAS